MDRSVGSPRTQAVVGVRGPGVSVFGLPTDKLAYPDFVTYARIDLNFHYLLQRCTHDLFIVGRIRAFNVGSLPRDSRKGHASKLQAR